MAHVHNLNGGGGGVTQTQTAPFSGMGHRLGDPIELQDAPVHGDVSNSTRPAPTTAGAGSQSESAGDGGAAALAAVNIGLSVVGIVSTLHAIQTHSDPNTDLLEAAQQNDAQTVASLNHQCSAPLPHSNIGTGAGQLSAISSDVCADFFASLSQQEPPAARANPQLTPENLGRLPSRQPPGMPEGPPAPVVGPSVAESSAEGATSTSVSGSSFGASSEVSLVSVAYSADAQARICNENPVTFTDSLGRPARSVQHAWNRHRGQFSLPADFPQNWNNDVGLRFVDWLRQQLDVSVMHDVTYRGVDGHRLFFNARNNLGTVVRVGARGQMDLVAAFPLSAAQLRYLLSQGGRVN